MKLRTEVDFDAAHRLVGHKGLCNNLHGHMWKVIIEIEGPTCDLDEVGILWDFGKRKELKTLFDHKTILKACPENDKLIDMIQETCGPDSVFVMDKNPTAEHLVTEILNWLKSDAIHNMDSVNVGRSATHLKFKVKVYESPNSYAEGEL